MEFISGILIRSAHCLLSTSVTNEALVSTSVIMTNFSNFFTKFAYWSFTNKSVVNIYLPVWDVSNCEGDATFTTRSRTNNCVTWTKCVVMTCCACAVPVACGCACGCGRAVDGDSVICSASASEEAVLYHCITVQLINGALLDMSNVNTNKLLASFWKRNKSMWMTIVNRSLLLFIQRKTK